MIWGKFKRLKQEFDLVTAAAANHAQVMGDLFLALRAGVRLLEAIVEQPMGGQRQNIRKAIKALRTKVDNYQPQFEQGGIVPRLTETPIVLEDETPRIAVPNAAGLALVGK